MSALILVAGSIASNYRNGGIAWERLSWALGLRRLGLDILVVDQLDRARCVYPEGTAPSYESCLNRSYFEAIVDQFGLAGSAVLIGNQGESLYGPSYPELLERAEEAAMLVNVAGNLRVDEVKRRARLRVYVDVDPGLTHISLESGEAGPRVGGHDLYFTIGENVGKPGNTVPAAGLNWLHTRQPVLLDEWPVSPRSEPHRFTTVGTWRGVGPHGRTATADQEFAQKADELAKVVELPRRAAASFELALKMAPADAADRQRLEEHGWRVVDAASVAFDPNSFRQYVQGSDAEFSVAKGAYAETRSGWFSDRTTRYLASGKPALVQDTGFDPNIPVGEGLFKFQTIDDAVDGANRIVDDYERHSRAAREIAETYFDSDKVLAKFLEDVDSAR